MELTIAMLLVFEVYTPSKLCLWGCIMFSCPSVCYVLVYEQGVSIKHCLLTFLVKECFDHLHAASIKLCFISN